MDGFADGSLAISFIEVVHAQVIVCSVVTEHMIDDYQDGVGNSKNGTLITAASS